jgi:hypothetical protein
MSEKYLIVKSRNQTEFSERVRQLASEGFKVVETESYAHVRRAKKNSMTDSYFPYAAKMVSAREK